MFWQFIKLDLVNRGLTKTPKRAQTQESKTEGNASNKQPTTINDRIQGKGSIALEKFRVLKDIVDEEKHGTKAVKEHRPDEELPMSGNDITIIELSSGSESSTTDTTSRSDGNEERNGGSEERVVVDNLRNNSKTKPFSMSIQQTLSAINVFCGDNESANHGPESQIITSH